MFEVMSFGWADNCRPMKEKGVNYLLSRGGWHAKRIPKIEPLRPSGEMIIARARQWLEAENE